MKNLITGIAAAAMIATTPVAAKANSNDEIAKIIAGIIVGAAIAEAVKDPAPRTHGHRNTHRTHPQPTYQDHYSHSTGVRNDYYPSDYYLHGQKVCRIEEVITRNYINTRYYNCRNGEIYNEHKNR